MNQVRRRSGGWAPQSTTEAVRSTELAACVMQDPSPKKLALDDVPSGSIEMVHPADPTLLHT
jgi:hypothetical protein